MMDSDCVSICGSESSLSDYYKNSMTYSDFYCHKYAKCFDVYRVLCLELTEGYINSKH